MTKTFVPNTQLTGKSKLSAIMESQGTGVSRVSKPQGISKSKDGKSTTRKFIAPMKTINNYISRGNSNAAREVVSKLVKKGIPGISKNKLKKAEKSMIQYINNVSQITKRNAVPMNVQKPATPEKIPTMRNAKFLVAGQKVVAKNLGGRIVSDSDVFYFTMNKYADKIKLFKSTTAHNPYITSQNYKRFATCYDQQSKALIESLVYKSELPNVTSCATLFDPGESLRKIITLSEFIKTQYMLLNSNTFSYPYPRQIVDFSPISVTFVFNGRNVKYTIYYNKNSDKESPSLVAGGEPLNGITDAKDFLMKRVKKILGVDANVAGTLINQLVNRNMMKIKKIEPINFTINLNDEKVRRIIQSDTYHDFKPKNNVKKTKDTKFDFLKSNREFDAKISYEFNQNINFTYDKVKEKETVKGSSSGSIFYGNGTVTIATAPTIVKTLGDLFQILYCMKRNVFFATGDISAMAMGINIAREVNSIRRLKIIGEEPKGKSSKIGADSRLFFYVNYPASFKPDIKFYRDKTNNRDLTSLQSMAVKQLILNQSKVITSNIIRTTSIANLGVAPKYIPMAKATKSYNNNTMMNVYKDIKILVNNKVNARNIKAMINETYGGVISGSAVNKMINRATGRNSMSL